jgi:hypothetical protein
MRAVGNKIYVFICSYPLFLISLVFKWKMSKLVHGTDEGLQLLAVQFAEGWATIYPTFSFPTM